MHILVTFTMSCQHCWWYFIYVFTTQKGVILPKIIYFQSQICWCCKLPRAPFISPILRLISLNFSLLFISIGERIYDSHFPYIWGLCIYLKCLNYIFKIKIWTTDRRRHFAVVQGLTDPVDMTSSSSACVVPWLPLTRVLAPIISVTLYSHWVLGHNH